MKIALVHDYLTQLGGAEKVLAGLQTIYPNSPVFVLLYNKKNTGQYFPPHKVNPTWLNRLPLANRYHHWYFIFMPSAAESIQLKNYDLIISSASSVGKGIKKGARALHICYCHTPTRYLWHDADHYIEEFGVNRILKKIIPLFIPHLRHWDLFAAADVDFFIANSQIVKQRIKKYYHRDSSVIYPPVETNRFHISADIQDYYLIGGRLVAYKKYDLAIQAFNKLNIKLKIFGAGPDLKRLKKLAGPNIDFLGVVDDRQKSTLYSHCRAFIYPQVEDFGITAVEAMASGRPVIAFKGGGATETILPGVSGEFFTEQIWESLAYTIIHFNPFKYNPQVIKRYAENFNVERFQREIKNFIHAKYKDFQLNQVFKIK